MRLFSFVSSPRAWHGFHRVQHSKKTNCITRAELNAAALCRSEGEHQPRVPALNRRRRRVTGSPTHGDGDGAGTDTARSSQSLPLGRDRCFHYALVLPITKGRSAISMLVTSECCFHIKFNKAGVMLGLSEGVGAKTKQSKAKWNEMPFPRGRQTTSWACGCASLNEKGERDEGGNISSTGSPGLYLYRGTTTSSSHNHTHERAPLQASASQPTGRKLFATIINVV